MNNSMAVDERINKNDINLLKEDKFTFQVLGKIMYSDPQLLLTDHKKFIICSSNDYYPIWIWASEEIGDKDINNIYDIVKNKGLLNGKYLFNMKYDLATEFIRIAKKDGINIEINLNMYAYDCKNIIEPAVRTDGSLHKCIESDFDDLLNFIIEFHNETGIDKKNVYDYKKDAKEFIDSGTTYLWKNNDGKSVASARYTTTDDLASINLVSTKKEYRRKYYALNLVYELTKTVKDLGFHPMLYTNADYIASNNCYKKIGYEISGNLCQVKINMPNKL